MKIGKKMLFAVLVFNLYHCTGMYQKGEKNVRINPSNRHQLRNTLPFIFNMAKYQPFRSTFFVSMQSSKFLLSKSISRQQVPYPCFITFLSIIAETNFFLSKSAATGYASTPPPNPQQHTPQKITIFFSKL